MPLRRKPVVRPPLRGDKFQEMPGWRESGLDRPRVDLDDDPRLLVRPEVGGSDAGLGMRLALSMALEIKEGKAPGTDTSELVAEWVDRHGQDSVEAAVGIARGFLTRPAELAKEMARRLGLDSRDLNN